MSILIPYTGRSLFSKVKRCTYFPRPMISTDILTDSLSVTDDIVHYVTDLKLLLVGLTKTVSINLLVN